MGWFSSLFGPSKTPQEELHQAVQRALSTPQRRGLSRMLRGSDPAFQREVSGVIRNERSKQYHEHERQARVEEQRHHDYERPQTERYWDQALRLSQTKDELAKLKAAGSPYASQVEYNLSYLQRQFDNYLRDYDKQWERQKYDRKYQFKQQQHEYEKQTYETAYKQLEDARQEQQKRQAYQQALYTQSNVGRGGKGETQLGQGQKFSRFAPPRARGTYGRGRQQPRPSFTRAGK